MGALSTRQGFHDISFNQRKGLSNDRDERFIVVRSCEAPGFPEVKSIEVQQHFFDFVKFFANSWIMCQKAQMNAVL